MKYILASLFDTKSGLMDPPIPYRTEAEAMRSISSIISKHPVLSKYPDDFTLEFVGFFDNEDCYIESASKKTICNLGELYKADPIYAEEVSGFSAGTFPLSEDVEKSNEVVAQESSECEQKGRIHFGGSQK